jgi:hypothetical protein
MVPALGTISVLIALKYKHIFIAAQFSPTLSPTFGGR